MKSYSSTPKSAPKNLQQSSLNRLHSQLLQLQKNVIAQRKKIISQSKKQLNRSWRSLCKILKTEEHQKHNQEEEEILDSCLQLIIKQRISLERENLQIEKIRNLYEKTWNSSSKKKSGYRNWKVKKNFKVENL